MFRRCAAAVSFGATCRSTCRAVHSVAVLENVPPATSFSKLGTPPTTEMIAQAHRAPAAILDKVANRRLIAFTRMDIARATYAPLIATITDAVDFRDIAYQVRRRLDQDASKSRPTPSTGALKKFTSTTWKDMKDLVTFYEETMYPIRRLHAEYQSHELSNFHIKDVLKRGLSAFKQDYLDEQKKELTGIHAKMKACETSIRAAVEDAFTTAVCNDIANILRIGGEKCEHSHSMALRVLEDMNMMHVPYDDITREIVHAVAFNDGPFDNSDLLFEVIEYPERGEISLSQASLEKVSEDMLGLISRRHQTPLDDGTLLRSTDTLPMLQLSPE